ncbi:Alanine dehydrogenase/PNT, C-terminal domain [Rhizobium sp. NFR07]|uniref:zinc-dependent alcohol dehydrogenase n=1 Tax=Rhizobium sp. NFR07 TaxID=1566262 RepID=UPI0008EFB988|nr:zinc-binding alcohol dehydrogenase [Rhizobium sp. NFR07]SFB53976.1 Alanine dehydrogenase/PNT, C-terminal domain [Rhizobium sp. NFR07]
MREQEFRPAERQIVVKSLYSGISRGTESLVFNGKVPPSEHHRMRAPYQEGDFTFPVKYGYCLVGKVENGPDSLRGRTVFALYPHQDIFAIEAEGVEVVPEGVPADRAVLAANMETALNIVWDAQASPGDRIVVFGAGVVGLLTAYIASRIVGTEVTICDVNPARSKPATDLGLEFRLPASLDGEYDCLINASASADALVQALQLGGLESRIVEASWYGDRQVEIPLGGVFHANRLAIIGSQVGSLPPHKRARWTYSRRLAKALELLRDDRLDCLITGETPFNDLKDRYADILRSSLTLCHRIAY